MKVAKTFQIAILAIITATVLAGCASDSFRRMKDPVIVGNKEYVSILSKHTDALHGSAITLTLVESELEQNAPPTINLQGTAQYQQVPNVQYQQVQGVQYQQVQGVQYQQVQNVPTRTHVVNNNNQGSIGWVAGAFQGAVGGAAVGTGIALIRPSTVTANGGGGGGGGSSSSSSAAAAAASGQ